MHLGALLQELPLGWSLEGLAEDKVDELAITGICCDSRRVVSGSLFTAIPGFKHDGHDFVLEAAANGAAAVAVEHVVPDCPCPMLVVDDTRAALADLSAAFFGHPSRKLRVIGVTGTNGKTTVTYLLKSILEAAGHRVGLIGTIQSMIGESALGAERTTPEAPQLQGMMADMITAGIEYLVMEVSSHALTLQRTRGVDFDMALFTNLSQDHLDFHSTLQDYAAAKAKLFSGLDLSSQRKASVINLDDDHGWFMAQASTAPIVTYAVNQPSQIQATHLGINPDGLSITVRTPWGELFLKLQLHGRFNAYNALAAAAAGLYEGVGLDAAKTGLEQAKPAPGRFEAVTAGQDFVVIVDYAHTPDGLKHVLDTAKEIAEGRVIVVLGAGGDRDASKREPMGRAAAEGADYVILTSDNPRSEDPHSICRQLEQGVTAGECPDYEIILERREAIRQAVNLARTDDLVLIAGKGHETYQEFADTVIHFDDREEVTSAIKELLADGTTHAS